MDLYDRLIRIPLGVIVEELSGVACALAAFHRPQGPFYTGAPR